MSNRNMQTAIDLSGLGLDKIEEQEDAFSIGCMCTLRQLEIHEALNRYFGGAMKLVQDILSVHSSAMAQRSAEAFLEDCMAVVVDSLGEVREYFEENGIDVDSNDPATDKNIPFNYDITNFEEGKAKCKEALQDKFGLNKDGSPVFAMVSRMVGMKGFDLVQSIADGLVDRGIELVILGSGESQYENFFSDLCARHPGRVGTYIGFEPALSQEIYAGADAFIMPSKSEPCGLAQMVACRYGTPPIVRETGGLRDSIHDSTMGEGNGFTFAGYNAHELYVACCNAQNAYYDKENWKNLVHHCMECDFSWDVSAKSYEGLYNETANLW